MREYFAEGLPLRRSIQSAVIQDLAKPRLIKTFHEVEDARVLGGSRRLQRRKIVEYDRVQIVGMVTHSGKPSHPDSICCKYMIQGAMQATEVRAYLTPVRAVRQACGHFVEPCVRPSVVTSHHGEMRFHLTLQRFNTKRSPIREAALAAHGSSRRLGWAALYDPAFTAHSLGFAKKRSPRPTNYCTPAAASAAGCSAFR